MTYEYLCTACAHAWEAEQSISEAALTVCPNCQQATAKRQVSGGAGFILKGGGWYSDLYSSTKPGETKSSETKSSETKSSETKSSETKPSETKPSDKKDGGSGGGTPGKAQSTPPATT